MDLDTTEITVMCKVPYEKAICHLDMAFNRRAHLKSFKEFSLIYFELCIFTTIDPISNKGKFFLYNGAPGRGL